MKSKTDKLKEKLLKKYNYSNELTELISSFYTQLELNIIDTILQQRYCVVCYHSPTKVALNSLPNGCDFYVNDYSASLMFNIKLNRFNVSSQLHNIDGHNLKLFKLWDYSKEKVSINIAKNIVEKRNLKTSEKLNIYIYIKS